MTPTPPAAPRGILRRLRHDVRGVAIIYMAAILLPLLAFTGSAIDMGRLYAVKTRLQQACDAGALAGRKAMAADTLDATAVAQAQTFFHSNFPDNWFQTTAVTFRPTLTSDTQVQGTASASVPMTVMAMFGQGTRTIAVNCQARYDVADTDVMFVLDTTGSMACPPAGGNCNNIQPYVRNDGTTGYYAVEASGSKISGLREAVLLFYDTVAASADATTHIRYGFATYSSGVNMGSALYGNQPSALPGGVAAYLVEKGLYHSRRAVDDRFRATMSTTVVAAATEADCNAQAKRQPALTSSIRPDNGQQQVDYAYDTTGVALRWVPKWDAVKKSCAVDQQQVTPVWRYAAWPLDVSKFRQGQSATDPSKVTGAQSTWQGCIEERFVTPGNSFDPTNPPHDLDPSYQPKTSVNAYGFPTTDDTRWQPMWLDAFYYRSVDGSPATGKGDGATTPYGEEAAYNGDTTRINPLNTAAMLMSVRYVCGMPARRLDTMTRAQVSAYVNNNDFRAMGTTYHDTGMIWGARMIAKDGIFKADTAAWPNRPAPKRYIVFMTDGDMNVDDDVYGMYGLERYDGRVTGQTGNAAQTNNLGYHNARFVATCKAAQQTGVSVFVIGFGQTLNNQLMACATPGQAYYASDNAALKAAFQKIAQQVAMLRVSK